VSGRSQFLELLRRASAELYTDNPTLMSTGDLLPSPNVIHEGDLELFFAAVEAGIVTIHRGGKFNTLDRPKPGGRWSLLSRSGVGGWYNAEYLPQLAAYGDLLLRLSYPSARVLFELPSRSLQLDLAVLNDDGQVVVLGEAKRDALMLDKLRDACLSRYGEAQPGVESKRRGDETRQLAWRIWTVAPQYTWLIGPGHRVAYGTTVGPLRLDRREALPAATELGLAHEPPRPLEPPTLN
jgi:hypothetical protein